MDPKPESTAGPEALSTGMPTDEPALTIGVGPEALRFEGGELEVLPPDAASVTGNLPFEFRVFDDGWIELTARKPPAVRRLRRVVRNSGASSSSRP